MFQSIANISTVKFPISRDERGALVSLEFKKVIPFQIVRVFLIFDVPVDGLRGGHAHKQCQQFMICSAGHISIDITDGIDSRVLSLEAGMGIHIPPAIYATLRFHRPGSVLIVFCDRPYEKNDYIHDHTALKVFRQAGPAKA